MHLLSEHSIIRFIMPEAPQNVDFERYGALNPKRIADELATELLFSHHEERIGRNGEVIDSSPCWVMHIVGQDRGQLCVTSLYITPDRSTVSVIGYRPTGVVYTAIDTARVRSTVEQSKNGFSDNSVAVLQDVNRVDVRYYPLLDSLLTVVVFASESPAYSATLQIDSSGQYRSHFRVKKPDDGDWAVTITD